MGIFSLAFLILGKVSFEAISLIFLFALIFFFVFRRLRRIIFQNLSAQIEKLQGSSNLLQKKIEEKESLLKNLPSVLEKADFLFKLSLEVSKLAEAEEIFNFLQQALKRIFPQVEAILIFVLEEKGHNLVLRYSLKREGLTVREKKGEAIERWILKNNSALMVEDLTRDFRFDCNKILAYKERGVRSLLGSPLSIGEKILGIVQIESKLPNFFSLEDLRILRSICDLIAVVLERANLLKKTQELAIKDPLTSLFLRDFFLERLEEELKRAKLKGANLGLLMIDIDDFKKINDTYGHIVGDMVLKRLADILVRSLADAGGFICRFGGEEFLVCLVECKPRRAIAVAEEIRKKVEGLRIAFRRKEINFTVSLGLAMYPEDGFELNLLLEQADKLLYKAKKEGKNRLCFSG